MDAHIERGDIVEKNHAAAAIRLVGLAQQRPDHRLVPARLVANRTAQPVVFFPQTTPRVLPESAEIPEETAMWQPCRSPSGVRPMLRLKFQSRETASIIWKIMLLES